MSSNNSTPAKKTLLIVEDERIVAKDLQQTLQRLAYHVPMIASTGAEAVHAVQTIKPDLVLMDIQLRGNLDGIQTTAEIRKNYDVPVIYLTAFADEDTLIRAKITEPFGYIIKPFDEHDVHSTIEMALYKHSIEKKLKASEHWLTATLNSVGDAVIATDINEAIIFMNPTAEKLTGWSKREATAKKLTEICIIVNEATQQTVENPLTKAIQEKKSIGPPGTAILISKNGKKMPISYSASPIIDHRGDLLGAVFVFKDKSLQVELEKQLRESQKMEAVGRLAGGIAHDFNNLLMVILGNADLARESLSPSDLAYSDLEKIEGAAIHARDLIDQLLTFSRRKAFKKEPVNINASIHEFLKLVNRIIGENIRIQTNLCTNTVTVLADPVQIQQILMNLCLNAKDAMPDGGLLSISTKLVRSKEMVEEPRFKSAKIHALTQNNFIELRIEDTGKGIDNSTREQIFEPFFSTKDILHGTGLGLAVVYGIIDQYDGFINVESTQGKGTSISIFLPALESTQDISTPGPAKKDQFARNTILVVEDDDAVRKTTTRILNVLGYHVMEATSGKEALKQFKTQNNNISAVVIDVAMPEMSGPELYEKLKTLRIDLPTVFVTGYDIHDKLNLPQNNGKNRFTILKKPFTKDSLDQKIQDALLGK